FARAVQLDQSLVFDQVDGLPGFATESHQDVRGDVGVFGKPGQRPVELVVVRPAVLHGAAGLVGDGHHAVHVRILPQAFGAAGLLGDVPARAGRAVDGADDGDVVARADPSVAPVVAHEETRFGCGRRGGTIAAEGVVALEGRRADVVDVDMAAGEDVLACEADYLAGFLHRLARDEGSQNDP